MPLSLSPWSVWFGLVWFGSLLCIHGMDVVLAIAIWMMLSKGEDAIRKEVNTLNRKTVHATSFYSQ